MLYSRQSDVKMMSLKFHPGVLILTLSTVTVANVCFASEPEVSTQTASMPMLWLGIGGAVALVGLVFAITRLGKRKPRKQAVRVEAAAPAVRPVQQKPVFRNRPVLDLRHRNGAKETNGFQKKKAFDYNRYFWDLHSHVYSQSYAAERSSANGSAETTRGMSTPIPLKTPPSERNGSHPQHHELIETQRALIQEQQRLIQEQTKLIEEKSRLISEKNQVLKLQSELMENKLL